MHDKLCIEKERGPTETAYAQGTDLPAAQY